MLKTAVLPGRDEIMRRLATVNDSPWTIERFYPLIAAAADTERAGVGLNLLFELAISDVADDDRLAVSLRMQMPSWLQALVDDGGVLADALAAFYELNPWLRESGEEVSA